MSLTIQEGIDRANKRKQAALGDIANLVHSSEAGDRAIFSGLDIDYQELATTAHAVGVSVALGTVQAMPVSAAVATAWVDGLLIGLLMGMEIDR